MVREVKFTSFVTHHKQVSTNSISSYFRQFSISRKFLEIREISENSENVVSETLFSMANTSANISRIDMKSTWSDSLESEVF